MRNTILSCGVMFSVLAAGMPALAAEVETTWQQPEKFTDIRPANDSRKRYQEQVIKQMDQVFVSMAEKLPEGYKWQVTVTDLDLAGDVDYFAGGAGQALRIVKDIHSPAIKFNYVLRDKHGEEVASGEEKLRDMGFMHGSKSIHETDTLYYEKQMLTDWFNKKLMPQVTEHAQVQPKVSQ